MVCAVRARSRCHYVGCCRARSCLQPGHGVPPDADPGVLAKVVELVHTEGAQLRREAREELAGASAAGGR